jgi:hypothetical protein
MTGTEPISSAKAFEVFTDHPRFKYRGCAPDVDDPTRAAGDVGLSRNAWITDDRDGAEPQREREAREAAAIDVCVSCPVMVLCDQYANSVRPDGRLAEPRWIWGGRTARERTRSFERREKPARVARALPVERLETPQKLAVLRALAMCWDPFEVAAAAGVTVRTANWQRSKMVSDMGLPKSASRERMLAVAVARGLVDASLVVRDGGRVPAVPPATKTTDGARQLPVFTPEEAGPKQEKKPGGGRRGVRRSSLRKKFASVAGQEGLMVAVPAVAEPVRADADVCQLPVADTLGAAA